jgi:phage baseplate assembly protein W
MPIPQTRTVRVDPLDLQKNVSIGVGLPFNDKGVFKVTYTTKDQIKANLINLLLTGVGERIMNPEFGTTLQRYIFEGITDSNSDALVSSLQTSIATFIPQIIVISITATPNTDYNLVDLYINYILRLSGEPDEVTIQLT